ncbi:ATP-binding protein [Kitasatospora purpeofusca]|uniref:ATP-binding protein n=1 Tax=Kitasatospora purpeofusca TaxID=67352 RepID=UPI00386FC542|nr:ATP-binding protein [Kitasatospora purpeofusca]
MLIEASRETRVVVPASAALPYQPESASAARQLVRNKLLNWELGELVDDALLVVSELVANAVRTGCQSKMLVTICRVTAQSVRITVWDGSRTLPCMIQAGGSAESGRGLPLIHAITRGHWGASLRPLGKGVHADLTVRAKTS